MVRINGRLLSRYGRPQPAGWQVEVWARGRPALGALTVAPIDEAGVFRLSLAPEALEPLLTSDKPGLFFRVFYRDELITSTEGTAYWTSEQGERELVIEVDPLPMAAGDSHTL